MHFPIGASITAAQLAADPYPIFQRLRDAEPITWAPALGQWLVTRRAIAMDVLRDHERFRTDGANSPIRDTFGAQMLSTEGEVQRRYKLACAPPFNARAAGASLELVEGIVQRAVERIGRSSVAELRSEFAAPIAVETIARVIGLPESHDAELREWYDTFADALANYEANEDTRSRARAAVRAFRMVIAPGLAAPKASDQTLLASLARAHPRMLDDEEIGSNALIVLFGGIETTEGLIANALWSMFLHPEALARARASDEDLERCIEESLRWEPAVQTCTRYTPASCELHGVEIPANSVVQCMIGAMNRDPAHCADSDAYDPWRAEVPNHAAFGFGRHFCLGAAVARLEARVAIRQLFTAFPHMHFDVENSAPPYGHEFRKAGAVVVSLT